MVQSRQNPTKCSEIQFIVDLHNQYCTIKFAEISFSDTGTSDTNHDNLLQNTT